MNSLREIADLNAAALTLLQQNEPEQAKRMFVCALRDLQTLCSDENDAADTLPTRFVYSDLGCRTNRFSVGTAAAQQHDLLDQSDFNQIYNRAFLLTNDIPAEVQETAAVLFFNIGLVHHLISTRTGKSADMVRAIQFYERSFNYLGNSLDQSVAGLIVLMGAVCHNMMHCYSSFFQFFKVAAMVEQLSQVVCRMASSESICSTDYEFFRASLFFSKWNDFRYSPAA